MSIYATLWELQFPQNGQPHSRCAWEAVLAQGVPDHIGDEPSNGLEFLPPREQSSEGGLRAVVFVRATQPKGTARSSQEYPNPLLLLTAAEYFSTPFPHIHEQLLDALRGARPRVVGEVQTPDGGIRVLLEDGTSLHCGGEGEA